MLERIRYFLYGAIWAVVLCFCIVKCATTKASELKYVEVRKLYLEVDKAVMNNRSYFLKNRRDRNYGLNMGLNLDITQHFFYNAKVVSLTDQRQFRFVGLHFDTGVRLFDGMELYLRHFSGHALDQTYNEAFPEDNAVGLRLTFIDR